MKYSLLMVIFLTAACGKYEVNTGSGNFSSRTLSLAPLSAAEQSNFGIICNALNAKAGKLQNSPGTNFNFAVSQTDCDGSGLSGGSVTTTIQSSTVNGNTNYNFVTLAGQNFIFPNVETDTSGVLATTCSSVGNIQNATTLPNGDVQWITSSSSFDNCPSATDELCVELETGSPQGGGSYLLHTREWIRFKTNSTQANYGFYTYRKKITKGFCAENQAVTYQANLK